ncbi:hypothetical protein FB45DRAFT_244849 [Roridomyces roridus]|uniref:Uncharacterized protein n=1 Tax=Roridomyces roridus TaxID=1738132 RepID=A0AAD7BB21_9AGAR|nr:hypothetical protein FB45DRAFT_244849 [Roridomyces roridus]
MKPTALASTLFLFLAAFIGLALAHTVASDPESPESTVCVYDRGAALQRRADADSGGDGSGSIGVSLPSVGLSLGNITTKLGNINLTVTNVTISTGNIDIENIDIGNITIIISVPLPGASPVNAFSAFTSATSISSSTGSATSTVSPPTSVTQTATSALSDAGNFLQRMKRQDSSASLPPTTTTSGIGLPTVTVSSGDVNAGAGNIDTEIGNITIFVGNVNVSIGDVNIKNVSIGNIFVLVQIGQPDLNGALGNLTNALEGTNPTR